MNLNKEVFIKVDEKLQKKQTVTVIIITNNSTK